ncbi:hypothetical protein [Streptomyces sp. H27-C3]|uniref:hypothetical protein n=1 Tax=Streptomyces sp. H27-C3 TaxID=3046305 RepID=UPI0024BA0E0D|nr:hypothetical protein [Streptomyces sp. H27-C3]MDJ0463827.1 hypothetical protein [Streptomyces sp. H27-C3]
MASIRVGHGDGQIMSGETGVTSTDHRGGLASHTRMGPIHQGNQRSLLSVTPHEDSVSIEYRVTPQLRDEEDVDSPLLLILDARDVSARPRILMRHAK